MIKTVPPLQLQVGEPYLKGVAAWPDGLTDYRCTELGHELRLFRSCVSPSEFRAVSKGQIHLRLLMKAPVMALICRFDGFDWIDCPFSPHLRPHENTSPVICDDLVVNMVDAMSGLVLVHRRIDLPTEATRRLRSAIRFLLDKPFNRNEYDATLAILYSRFRRSRDFVAAGGPLTSVLLD